jgi:DNA-binding transcriptional MerR regulator
MTISEAAEACGVTAHTLRYHERAGLLEPVGREAGGRRRDDDADLTRIAFLERLAEMERHLELIDDKIDVYREKI